MFSSTMNTHHESLDERTRIYLAVLALRQPFSMHIAATPSQMFREMSSRWPSVSGWEYHANEIQYRIQSLADPLIEPGDEQMLRLAINVSQTPQTPLPLPDAPAIHAVYDAEQGVVVHRSYNDNQVPFDPSLDDVSVGMTILYQRPSTENADLCTVTLNMQPEGLLTAEEGLIAVKSAPALITTQSSLKPLTDAPVEITINEAAATLPAS